MYAGVLCLLLWVLVLWKFCNGSMLSTIAKILKLPYCRYCKFHWKHVQRGQIVGPVLVMTHFQFVDGAYWRTNVHGDLTAKITQRREDGTKMTVCLLVSLLSSLF